MDGGAIARRPELSNGKNIVAIRIGSFDRSLEQVNGGAITNGLGCWSIGKQKQQQTRRCYWNSIV